MKSPTDHGFFFTAWQDDPVTGGRDGLGLLPVWSRIARTGIVNVTTVSADLAGWRTVICCVGLVQHVLGTEPTDSEWTEQLMAAERLIAYARVHGDTTGTPRGVGRAREHLKNQTVTVAGNLAPMILQGQVRTGAFGQIGRPAITSGLLREGYGLSDAGRQIWELQRTRLVEAEADLTKLLTGKRALDTNGDAELLRVLATLCRTRPNSDTERALWHDHVLVPSTTIDAPKWRRALQQDLVEAMRQRPDQPLNTTAALATLEVSAETQAWLQTILDVEQLLGPLDGLFARILQWTSTPRAHDELATITRKFVDGGWSAPKRGPRDLPSLQAAVREAYGSRADEMLDLLETFSTAWPHPDKLVRAVLGLNSWICKRRKSAPWVATDSRGLLFARIGRSEGRLPGADSLQHGYYLDELRRLTHACYA